MDYSESVDKDADPTLLKENIEVEGLFVMNNCDGESLVVIFN